ncbi:hypothetical protein CSB37_01595 [bacterium DOLZORAL124_38_8]|nr:MAG: hypothetical protein CSB37_01595 [bacterium DOLZORAL124_38_8]
MSETVKDIGVFVLVVLSAVGGFFLGKKNSVAETTENQKTPSEKTVQKTVSVIELTEINQDLLTIKLPDKVRVIWSNGKNSVEKSGVQVVPLGQVDTVDSKKFWKFPYVGNAKTRKFYPAQSYPARGTKIQYRRFFESKTAALRAGFLPSKLVK